MNPSLKKEHILELSNASSLGMTKQEMYHYIKIHHYEKVGPGIYIAPNEFSDDLYVLHKRCPQGVISHEEALYHYGLIDREPAIHAITIYSGYNASRLTDSGYKVYYVNKTLLDLGKTYIKDQFSHEIPMYDLERTIIDMIRNRKDIEIQEFITALKSYAERKDKDLVKLSEYAKAFHVDKILKGYLEVLL